jgi:outer membrane receptor protein involved in Fe transport
MMSLLVIWKRIAPTVAILLLSLLLPGTLGVSIAGPQAGGRIKGAIVAVADDKRERLPNVVAVLSGPIPRERKIQVISDEEGNYSFGGLAAGDYIVTVAHPGFENFEQRVIVPIDATVELNILLQPSTVRENVTVTTDPDRINTTESSVPGQISSATLRNVPLVNEKFQDALPLLPGVVRSPDGALNIKGTRPDQTGVLVSSLNVTDPVTGNLAIDLPLEAVESVQVFSNPFSAEYGKFTGAVTSIETRSGTNKWRYLLTNVLVRPRFRDGHFYGVQSATPRLAVGGPIRKDKLFFFQSFEYRFVRSEVSSLPAAQRDRKLEGFDSFSRLDFNINAANRLTVSFSLFPQKRDSFNLSTFVPQNTAANLHQRGWFFAVNEQATLSGGSLLQSSFSVKQFDVDIFGNGSAPFVINPQTRSGSWFDRQARSSRRYEWLEIFSLPEKQFHGQHAIRFGVNVSRTAFAGTDISSPVRVARLNGTTSQNITFTGPGNLIRNNTEFAAFVQNKWNAGKRVTLDLGIRYDRNGIGKKNNVAPRFGFAVLPFRDDRTVIRGGVGLFYDKIPINVGVFNQYQQLVITTFAANGTTIIDGPRVFRNLVESGDYENPYGVAWSLQADHEFHRFLLRLGYEERRSRRDFILEPRADGRLLLKSDGQSQYREFQATMRYRLQEKRYLYLAYVRSRATGDVNDFNTYFGNARDPIIRANEKSLQPFDAPNRLLFWGDISLPKQITLTPVMDWHTGFPFSLVDEDQNFVGVRNRGGRFPAFFALDLQVTKGLTIKVPKWGFIPSSFQGKKFPGRFGIKLFNITSHWNPRDVQNNLDSPAFGTFYNSSRRSLRLKFEFVKF